MAIFGFTKAYIAYIIPATAFYVGWRLDRMETQRLTMFRDRSALYRQATMPATPSWPEEEERNAENVQEWTEKGQQLIDLGRKDVWQQVVHDEQYQATHNSTERVAEPLVTEKCQG
ncbi:hypothetical protein B566_EDAN015941 [Ephemera danica]|nr:hypothetical protein B566_EDAN015941 [Ephemera danica]